MPNDSSASQEPEKLEPPEASTPIPDPSPVMDLDKSKAWEKEKDATQTPPETSAGKAGSDVSQ